MVAEFKARKLDFLYWILAALIILISVFGIIYALTAPPVSIPLDNIEARKLIPIVTEKTMQHSRWSIAIGFLWTIISTVLILTFLQYGLAKRLSDFSESKTSNLLLQVTLYSIILSLVIEIITLPLSYLTGFVFDHHFGLSSEPLSQWLLDTLKGFALGSVVEIPLWTLLLFLVRKFPKGWPYIQAATALPIMLFMTFISPILFEPVFNKIQLMEASPLRDDIKKLAAKAGLPNAPVFVSDKSKQTNTINAYVTGIGLSERIVIWDTTLKKMPKEQTLCVVAHELGHYALHHILIGCGIGILFIIWSIPVNLYFTPLFFKYLPEKWKIKKVQDLAAITMFVYVSHCAGFFMEPFGNFYSRSIEKDADMYGLKLHHDPINFARTYAFLSNENLSDPCPPKLLEVWLFSHPPLATRIKYVTEPDAKN